MSQTLPSWVSHFFDGFYAQCDLQWPADYQKKIAKGIVKHLNLPQNAKVFDQCCGEGYLAKGLNDLGCQVWGVDQSELYIKKAQQLVPTGTFVAGDAGIYHPPVVLDGAVNWHTSLGYGGYEGALLLLKQLTASLPQGKRFLIDVRNVEQYKQQSLYNSEQIETKKWGNVVMTRSGEWIGNVLRQNWTATQNKTIVWQQSNADCYHPSLEDLEHLFSLIGAKRICVIASFDDNNFNPHTSERMIVVGEMLQ